MIGNDSSSPLLLAFFLHSREHTCMTNMIDNPRGLKGAHVYNTRTRCLKAYTDMVHVSGKERTSSCATCVHVYEEKGASWSVAAKLPLLDGLAKEAHRRF